MGRYPSGLSLGGLLPTEAMWALPGHVSPLAGAPCQGPKHLEPGKELCPWAPWSHTTDLSLMLFYVPPLPTEKKALSSLLLETQATCGQRSPLAVSLGAWHPAFLSEMKVLIPARSP